MAMPRYDSVDDYITAQPKTVQRLLKQMRATIRKAVPEAVESISYGIPTFKLRGRPLLYFAAWKEHLSLYPSNARLVARFKKELAPYEVNGKGTIRLPITEPVPPALIAGIARFRAMEVGTKTRAAGTVGKAAKGRAK